MLRHIAFSSAVLILALAFSGFVTNAQNTLDDLYSGIDPINSFENSSQLQSDGCDGECVRFFLCKENQIITDGVGVIDIRFGDEPKCHYLDTCCEQRNVLDKPPPGVFKPPGIKRELGLPTCGLRNVNGVNFRISGSKDEAEYGEFPWMVAIMMKNLIHDGSVNVYQCGGSLIAPNVVLTAAHCVFNKPTAQLIARAGEWDTQTQKELYKHQDQQVAEVITHEAFNKGSLANDVALLILVKPFVLAETIQPICLPPKEASFDYANCFASGWGKDQFGKLGKYQVILKKIGLPVMPHADCQRALRTTRLGRRFTLHHSFLCAGGFAGQDTCRGDGGSPLVCPVPGSPKHYYQAGIVAWGIGCGENGIPGVYVNVAFFRDWIDQQLLEKSILARDYVFTIRQ